jgi:uncharacterized protein (DUF2235 family)
MYGLIRSGNEPLVPYAIRMMMAINNIEESKRQDSKKLLDDYFGLARQFKDHFCIPCNPYFIGVWDTVSSVGWIENPLRLPYTANNPDVRIGRHAVSIDERRAFFRSNLWHPAPDGGPKDLKQVWFPGVHCDVGGGYPAPESGLSKIALQWMLKEAGSAGLMTDSARVDLMLGRSGGGYAGPRRQCRVARVSDRSVATRRVHPEAALRLDAGERGAATEPVSSTHDSGRLAHSSGRLRSRIGVSEVAARQRCSRAVVIRRDDIGCGRTQSRPRRVERT